MHRELELDKECRNKWRTLINKSKALRKSYGKCKLSNKIASQLMNQRA